MSTSAPLIGVLGHFADANHGDDACAMAVIRHCARQVPDSRFVLFCRYPAIGRARFGLPAFPVRRLAAGQTGPWQPPSSGAEPSDATTSDAPAGWRARARAVAPLRLFVRAARTAGATARAIVLEGAFLWSSYRRLRGVDLLLVTGSNPVFDYFGGFWGFPYTMWKWAMLARLAGAKFGFVSVGAGPIISKRSGRLLAATLERAAYVSFRDRGSERLVRSHGYRGHAHIVPDLAHSLPDPSAARTTTTRSVGINPMIVHHSTFWPESDDALHDRYVGALAELAAGLVRDGYEVFFYGTQKDDRTSADEVQAAMRARSERATIPGYVHPETVDELIALCQSTDVLVTTRFHGAVFGVATARPTLAVCYHPKVREVLVEAGIGEFAFEFEEVSADLLRSAFDDLCLRRREIEARLQDHSVVNRARLHAQIGDLAGMLHGHSQAVAAERTADPRALATPVR